MSMRPLVAAALVGLAQAGAANAQSLAARVAAAPDGMVRISYTARADVTGNGGRFRGNGCLPSRLLSRLVSSPQT